MWGGHFPAGEDRVSGQSPYARRNRRDQLKLRRGPSTLRGSLAGAWWLVGTTSLRLLEAAADHEGQVHPFSGETDIFITPGARFPAPPP
jgi:hypothetical protein